MNDIVRNIFKEKPLIKDELFHIVQDKDPVCPEHYLVFPRHECKSLAQMSADKRTHLEQLIYSTFNEGFALLERGNVSFCTSMNAPAYAHGHIINTRYFKKNLFDSISASHNFTETDSILGGLALASDKHEYLLAGEINSRWLIASPFTNPTKRFIRTVLMENLIYETIH